jgi:hypothetical protein
MYKQDFINHKAEKTIEYKISTTGAVLFKSFIKYESLDKSSKSPKEDCYQKILGMVKESFPIIFPSKSIKSESFDDQFDYIYIEEKVSKSEENSLFTLSNQDDQADFYEIKSGLVFLMTKPKDEFESFHALLIGKDVPFKIIAKQMLKNEAGENFCDISIVNTYEKTGSVEVINDPDQKKPNKNNQLDQESHTEEKPTNAKPIAAEIPVKLKVGGCHSDGSSMFFVFLTVVLLIISKLGQREGFTRSG